MIRIPPVVTLDQQETDQTSIWKNFLEQIELSTTNHFISVYIVYIFLWRYWINRTDEVGLIEFIMPLPMII
jgi:hypothetical protein